MRKAGPHSVEGKKLRDHYFKHLTWVAMNKQKYYHHRAKAKCFFRMHMSIIMDACDQSNIDVPYLKDNPKDEAKKLATKMGAVLVHSATDFRQHSNDKPGGLYMFHIDERVTKGANFWLTCLLKVLNDERAKRDGKLPPCLTIQMDSAGENKNYTMACFCEWLVKIGAFRKIKICFLPVGHTHEDIDACFGRLSRQFVQYGTSVLNFCQMVDQAKKANAHTVDIWSALVSLPVCSCRDLFALLSFVLCMCTRYMAGYPTFINVSCTHHIYARMSSTSSTGSRLAVLQISTWASPRFDK
jgi:hypothetical protein